MPPLPGEDRLVTVFADIHYYFATPTVRPVLHRFDKASYLYIYHNSTRQTSRIEVANNPGTADQDAFNGYLDTCQIINSHRFPTLMTLIVDASGAAAPSPSSRSGRDPEEWRLASADPRDPGKQKYRIHTLDIYFWAVEDAKMVIDALKRLLHPSQLDVAELDQGLPEDKHEHVVNPVVQNLEHVAISDPAYQNSRAQSQQPQTTDLAPPPPPQVQHTARHTSSTSPVSPVSSVEEKQKAPDPAAFAPLAYNPAAPAPPEPIAHREDTPPPPDDGHGGGLASAHHDTGYVSQPAQPWTGVPQLNSFGHYGSPPPTFGSPPPSSTSIPPVAGQPSGSSHDPRYVSTAAQHYVPSPPPPSQIHGHEPVETPGAQFYPDPQAHKPLAHLQPQYADYLGAGPHGAPPPGGYAQFNYGQQQQQQQQQIPQSHGYDVHSQVYRPTEQEAAAHAHHHRPSRSDASQQAARKESRVDKVEKGVGKLWKKVDKKLGIS